MSKTEVSVKTLIRLDGSSLKSRLRPPRPIGSTKLRVPTPLMHINIDNMIAKISASYSKFLKNNRLTSNVKDFVIWINGSLFLNVASNETSISSNYSERKSGYISDEFN